MDISESTYASYGDVASDDAFTRGWVPRFLPQSATNIQERHNLDTNEMWGRFTASRADLDSIRARCAPIPSSALVRPRSPNQFRGFPKLSWWPAILETKSENLSNIFRHVDAPEFYLFFLSDTDSVIYWATSS